MRTVLEKLGVDCGDFELLASVACEAIIEPEGRWQNNAHKSHGHRWGCHVNAAMTSPSTRTGRRTSIQLIFDPLDEKHSGKTGG